MRKTTPIPAVVLVLAVMLWVGNGCRSDGIPSVEREELARFDIGRMQDELNLVDVATRPANEALSLAMRDGQFTIANGIGQKVMRCNAYGELVFMVYNDETNPTPRLLAPKAAGVAETRWANPWPLRCPGYVAVDARRHIFVVDTVPDERQRFDTATGMLLDKVVLHFDADGKFIEYIGQEGRGGTPFPIIERIAKTDAGTLVVVTRLPTGRRVHEFDDSGRSSAEITFPEEGLPFPDDAWAERKSALSDIAVAPDTGELYVKIDYYRPILDTTIGVRVGVEPDSSFLWTFSPSARRYTGHRQIPFYRESGESGDKGPVLYSMFGAAREGRVMLYGPADSGFGVLIMDVGKAEEMRRGVLRVRAEEMRFFTFNLSPDGVLSALLADQQSVRLVQWRTDRLGA
jgi:hypothetical protein